ncbi:SDR family oxidoreductase [Myxococcota bacterium]|nr:SDR family oxidoreductase [Myxococcota bacterium]
MSRNLEGKVAIVAGAGPGIGRSTALALARDGADVVVAARREAPLRALRDEVAEATGRRISSMVTDLSDPTQRETLVASTVADFGRLDGLVNVATHNGPRALLVEMDWEAYRESVEFNLVATLHLSGLAAQQMAEIGGGGIVNIGTLNSTSLLPKMAQYSSTKAAMVSASKTLAREVGGSGVRVNVVSPGFTEGTPLDAMFEQMAARSGGDGKELKARAAKTAALRRHVAPEDIADACVFLISDRGRNITGVELPVNAGQWIG